MRHAFTLPISLIYTLILAVILLPLVGKASSILLAKQAEQLDALAGSVAQQALLQTEDTGAITQITLPAITSSVRGSLLTIRKWRRERVIVQPLLIQTKPPRTAWLITVPISIPYQTGTISSILDTPLTIRIDSDPASRSLAERLGVRSRRCAGARAHDCRP